MREREAGEDNEARSLIRHKQLSEGGQDFKQKAQRLKNIDKKVDSKTAAQNQTVRFAVKV